MERSGKIWKKRLVITLLIIVGSILIFFPAWLPDFQGLPDEQSAVEAMQVFFLLIAASFWMGASRSAGDVGPFYKAMCAAGIAAALAELDFSPAGSYIPKQGFIFAILGYALILFFANRKKFGVFYTEFTSHPAAGFFASALIMIYVLARFLGEPFLWKAALSEHYHPHIPQTVEGYLELLACYLLMVGSIAMSLGPRGGDLSELDE